MATQAKEATAKDATATKSASLLSDQAPQLRTAEAIHRKQEQIVHAIETGSVSGKIGEQLNMAVKGLRWPVELRFRYLQMIAKHGAKTPHVTDPMLRTFLGEAPQTSFKQIP